MASDDEEKEQGSKKAYSLTFNEDGSVIEIGPTDGFPVRAVLEDGSVVPVPGDVMMQALEEARHLSPDEEDALEKNLGHLPPEVRQQAEEAARAAKMYLIDALGRKIELGDLHELKYEPSEPTKGLRFPSMADLFGPGPTGQLIGENPLNNDLQKDDALTLDFVLRFDASLSQGGPRPTHVYAHPDVIDAFYATPAYIMWYNACHPNRKIGRRHLQQRHHQKAALRLWRTHEFRWVTWLPSKQQVRLNKREMRRQGG